VIHRPIFHPRIEGDVREATGRYNEQSPALGERFKRTFYACVDALLNFPEKDAVRFDSVIRARLMRPFPYLIFYAVEGDLVFVLTVQYAGRKPGLLRAIVRGRRTS
jgi:plasmid stabilization system protein ParE